MTCLAADPRGRIVASGADDGSIALIDPVKGKILARLRVRETPISLAFDKRGPAHRMRLRRRHRRAREARAEAARRSRTSRSPAARASRGATTRCSASPTVASSASRGRRRSAKLRPRARVTRRGFVKAASRSGPLARASRCLAAHRAVFRGTPPRHLPPRSLQAWLTGSPGVPCRGLPTNRGLAATVRAREGRSLRRFANPFARGGW